MEIREILFRGKRVDNGEWVEGNYFHNFRKGESHMIIRFDSNEWFDVIPETIGQFTGNKIKARKIFEEDIVFDEIETDEGDIRMYFVVKWIEELSRFALLNVDSEYIDYVTSSFTSFDKYMDFHFNMDEMTIEEIEKMHYAGNIHDNPDLLN